jgi:hypothetical protein
VVRKHKELKMTTMVFFFLFLLFLPLSIIALFKPSVVIWWSKIQTKRRIHAFAFSLLISFISFWIALFIDTGFSIFDLICLCFFILLLFIEVKTLLKQDKSTQPPFPPTISSSNSGGEAANEHKKTWSHWRDCHKMASQITRQKRAYGCYLKQIDKTDASDVFIGRDADTYFTTLTDCTCRDFEKNYGPCKHMYRLAKELGLMKLPEFQPGEDDYTLL